MALPIIQPDAYLFDMDGLLLDSERVFLEHSIALLTPTGRTPADIRAFFLTLVGSSGAESMRRLSDYLGSKAEAQAFETRWQAAVAAHLSMHAAPKPTVLNALQALAGQGGRMAVVTSTHGARARHHLEVAGLSGFFEKVTGGDEVSANKPDPAPYLEMAAALGVDPARCAAFEDSDRGVMSATRAGCHVAQVPDLRPPDVPLPDLGQYVAQDLWAAVAHLGGTALGLNAVHTR
ncbi:MAG: HAD family phosphatase [Pseudomonadota bacterium]